MNQTKTSTIAAPGKYDALIAALLFGGLAYWLLPGWAFRVLMAVTLLFGLLAILDWLGTSIGLFSASASPRHGSCDCDHSGVSRAAYNDAIQQRDSARVAAAQAQAWSQVWR